MKNFTLLFSALLLTAFSWQANAQFGCGTGIAITSGDTQMAITTPGNGGLEDWNINPSEPRDGCMAWLWSDCGALSPEEALAGSPDWPEYTPPSSRR